MPRKFDPKDFERLDTSERALWQSPERFLDLLQPWPGMVYADIGCGVGYFTFPVAERVGPWATVYAVDIQSEMLEELERRARARGLTQITSVRCSEQAIPIQSSHVDAAVLANAFHELEAPLEFVREIRRILKLRGRLFVIDWKPIETPMGPPLSERVSLEKLAEALQAVGFAQLREHEIYPYHYVVEVER